MKKLKYIFITLTATCCLFSCSLDETNYSNIDTEVAYTSTDGYSGLINACYENLYYLYGKLDGIGPMEMGTDLWKIGSRDGSHGDITNYNSNLTPSTGVIETVWDALYCIVGYCNTAIYYQSRGTDFTSESIAASAAEARFMRGFALFHIVEQWGNVVLDTVSFAQSGKASEMAYRSPESDFYDLIISDLKIAVNDLPVSQADRGRATKKAAMAMLAKAYLQRTRLYDEGSAECIAYADSAYQIATELIDNASTYDCALYSSTASESGDTQAWDGDNNKDNDEFLFVEAIDHVNGYNPEGWNRGRTSQYYMMSIGSQAQNFGVASDGLRYGRANATVWSPTYYLLHDCFEPKMQKSIADNDELVGLALNQTDFTPDTRFENAFYYKYYAATTTYVTKANLARYKKDTLATELNSVTKRRIRSSLATGTEYNQLFPSANYYASTTNASANYEREDVDDALGCFTPNWELDTLATAKNKRLCVGITDYFNMEAGSLGQEASYTYFRNLFPSFKKYRNFKYVYTNQYDMMDIPIIRLTDIYLIAAEAAITKGTPSEGLEYLNAVRRHAALSTDASAMEVTADSMTIDYILKERARELCGEQWRWYDLKRTRRLTEEYLTQDGMNPYITTFDASKHTVRPIPQEFLDCIANPDEFGTNGY
ncbi:MAG: RagB/SusD family nutrient uptake outer membrane protein [Prevotellaceae bacterium]|nr:RagB/SusD family nutrient uptake outer membrane protein [Prevotellaceae bacterium]